MFAIWAKLGLTPPHGCWPVRLLSWHIKSIHSMNNSDKKRQSCFPNYQSMSYILMITKASLGIVGVIYFFILYSYPFRIFMPMSHTIVSMTYKITCQFAQSPINLHFGIYPGTSDSLSNPIMSLLCTAAYYLHFQHFPWYPESPITQSRTNMAERLTVTCVHLWPTLNPNQGRIEDLKPGLFILMPVMGVLGQACHIICQKASFKTVGLVMIILLLGRTTTTCSQYMTVL